MEAIFNFMSNAALPIIGAFIGFLGGLISARLSQRNKQADLIVHFHRQFDEMQKKRTEIRIAWANRGSKTALSFDNPADIALSTEIEMFFDRFWSLQFDEFHAWYEGYIPTSLYTYWAWARWRQFHFSSPGWNYGERNLRSTVKSLPERWAINTDDSSHVAKFVNLMLTLYDQSAAPDLKRLLKEYGPSGWERIARHLHFGN